MDQKRAKQLLQKFKTGNLTAQEKAILESWYLNWDVNGHLDLSESELSNDLRLMRAAIPHLNPKPSSIKLWPRLAAVASIILILGFGTYFYVYKTPKQESAAQRFKNDIKPGFSSATLTLANGKTIILSNSPNGQLALQGNVRVIKSSDGKIKYEIMGGEDNDVMEITITTRRKEEYTVVLADGTNVWLNSGSSITYPTAFNGKTREVTVTGEVYFEVAHNASKPFKVIASNQTVEVIGTHFNINAYPDESGIKTTLLEGLVKVSVSQGTKFLKPGQQAVLENNRLLINNADTEEAVAWKNGYFRFKNEDIKSIMRKLSRWYDIDVEFKDNVTSEAYTGKVSRFRNISQVLGMLELSKSVHFKIEGRRITVLK